MWDILLQYVFYVLVFWRPWGMWNLSSLTRDQAHCTGRHHLNYWMVREVPSKG